MYDVRYELADTVSKPQNRYYSRFGAKFVNCDFLHSSSFPRRVINVVRKLPITTGDLDEQMQNKHRGHSCEVRGITPRKFSTLYTQNLTISCSFGRKMVHT